MSTSHRWRVSSIRHRKRPVSVPTNRCATCPRRTMWNALRCPRLHWLNMTQRWLLLLIVALIVAVHSAPSTNGSATWADDLPNDANVAPPLVPLESTSNALVQLNGVADNTPRSHPNGQFRQFSWNNVEPVKWGQVEWSSLSSLDTPDNTNCNEQRGHQTSSYWNSSSSRSPLNLINLQGHADNGGPMANHWHIKSDTVQSVTDDALAGHSTLTIPSILVGQMDDGRNLGRPHRQAAPDRHYHYSSPQSRQMENFLLELKTSHEPGRYNGRSMGHGVNPHYAAPVRNHLKLARPNHVSYNWNQAPSRLRQALFYGPMTYWMTNGEDDLWSTQSQYPPPPVTGGGGKPDKTAAATGSHDGTLNGASTFSGATQVNSHSIYSNMADKAPGSTGSWHYANAGHIPAEAAAPHQLDPLINNANGKEQASNATTEETSSHDNADWRRQQLNDKVLAPPSKSHLNGPTHCHHYPPSSLPHSLNPIVTFYTFFFMD